MEDSLENYIKIYSSTKDGLQNNAKDNATRQNEIIMEQWRKECNARALKILEFLIEGKLHTEVFLRCLKHINQAYYQDIIEERAISNTCGYPLCGNHLPQMPKKRYFIDTKSNKVYDVTDRKHYCSNYCYKASIYIKQQIQNSPLWLRNQEEAPNFTLLPLTERGVPGEEVNVEPSTTNSDFTSVSSFTEASLDEMAKMEINKQDVLEKNDEKKTPEKKVITKSKLKFNPNTKTKKVSDTYFLKNIEKCTLEWLTLDTIIFIYGEEHIKKYLSKEELEEYLQKSPTSETALIYQRKYKEICHKLHITQIAEDKYDRTVLDKSLKPIPDYKILKERSKGMDLRVRAFYTGASCSVDSKNVEVINKTTNESQEVNDPSQEIEVPPVLPPLDNTSQDIIRSKVFLNSINKTLVTLTQSLGLPTQHMWDEVKLLVKTFRLEANNVAFKPIEWRFIAFIIIKILSFRDDKLKAFLETKESETFVNLMMKHVPNAEQFFSNLFELLGNVNLLLDKVITNYK